MIVEKCRKSELGVFHMAPTARISVAVTTYKGLLFDMEVIASSTRYLITLVMGQYSVQIVDIHTVLCSLSIA